MRNALLFGGARVLTGLLTAIGLGVDFSGVSLFGVSPNSLRITILVTFITFVVLTIWREVEIFLHPHPRIIWDGVSVEKASAMKWETEDSAARRPAYFTRLAFKNKAKNPSGAESTAKSMTAFIKIFDSNSILVDSWEGRWANNEEPFDYPSKWLEDRIDLEANNQQALLDVGLRFEGDLEFRGWHNQPDDRLKQGISVRSPLKPNCYKLQVILAASNMKEQLWQFSLEIPQSVQSEFDHIKIKSSGLK